MMVYNYTCGGGTYILGYQVVSSAIIDKYIGESARLIREMFGYARDHQVRAWLYWAFSVGIFLFFYFLRNMHNFF